MNREAIHCVHDRMNNWSTPLPSNGLYKLSAKDECEWAMNMRRHSESLLKTLSNGLHHVLSSKELPGTAKFNRDR
jgi:hypothetical protein